LARSQALALKIPDKVVHETIIEIFSTKMGITSGGFDFENTLLDNEKGDIESSAVGSLMIRRTFIPDMVPASFVACLCESLR
jgi:NAD-specific glutamate dehydrogenase